MDNDDIDLSHLLQEQPVPQGGAEAAKRTAISRRNRRHAITTTFGGIIIVALIVGVLVTVKPFDSKVTIENADSSHETTSTSTTAATTTTLDGRERYVGMEHDSRGGGLPLGTVIRLIGTSAERAEYIDYKNGDTIIYWVSDSRGDMLWFDVVTKEMVDYIEPIQSKVLATVDLPRVEKNHWLCVGTCYKSNKPDSDIIADYVWDDKMQASKVSWAGRINRKAHTFISIPTKDVFPSPKDEEPTNPLPARPELYTSWFDYDETSRNWASSREQVWERGGGGSSGVTFVDLMDDKESKRVFVTKSSTNVRDSVSIASTDNGNFNFGDTVFTYKGSPAVMLVYIDRNPQSYDVGNIVAAWKLDTTTYKFTQVAVSDVGYPHTATPTTTIP